MRELLLNSEMLQTSAMLDGEVEIQRKQILVRCCNTNCELSILTAGEGPSVVVLHGWLHSASRWTKLLEQLSGSFRLYAPDLPGFGASPPIQSHAITLSCYAAIIENLCVALSRKNELHAVIADSLGGLLVIKLLQRGVFLAPRLILSGVPTKGVPRIRALARYSWIGSAWLRGIKLLPSRMAKSVIALGSLSTMRRISNVDQTLIEGVLDADPRTAALLLKEMSEARVDSLTRPHRVQIAILRGEADRITRRADLQRLATQLEASYHEVRHAGHTPMLEAPEEYGLLISELLHARDYGDY
jgi:pimeloyl-ACP methyl ester carboxylesterase